MMQHSKVSDNAKGEMILNGLKQSLVGGGNSDYYLANSSIQMKSLMKSLSNGNLQFYDNLHKKYFDKAKESSKNSNVEKNKGKENHESQNQSNKTSSNAMTLSQFNYTISNNVTTQLKSQLEVGDSLKNSKPSMLRASSLQENKQDSHSQYPTNTMSINYKNSLYTKMRETALLDDNTQSIINFAKGKKSSITQQELSSFNRTNQNQSRKSYLSDSSESEDEQQQYKQRELKREQLEQRQQKQLWLKRQIDILVSKNDESKVIDQDHSQQLDKNRLSRKDLSSRIDMQKNEEKRNSNTQNEFVYWKEKKDDSFVLQQLQKKEGEQPKEDKIQFNQLLDSQLSPNLGISQFTEQQQVQQRQQYLLKQQQINTQYSSQQSSIILSQPEYNQNLQSQYQQENTNVIFEQANKENGYEEEEEVRQQLEEEVVDKKGKLKCDELKAEDLTTIIEQAYIKQCGSSTGAQSEIYKTYQEIVSKTRDMKRNLVQHMPQQKKNLNSHKHSNSQQEEKPPIMNKNVYQYCTTISQNKSKQKTQNNQQSMKNSQFNDDGVKSDFTFLLSNPTDILCDCTHNDCGDNSFVMGNIQQKVVQTQQNSDIKPIQLSHKGKCHNNKLQNKLTEIVASPIYSEGGGLPGSQFYYGNQNNCQHCGCSKLQSNRLSLVQQKLSYNNFNQSIQEESVDQEEEREEEEQDVVVKQNTIDKQQQRKECKQYKREGHQQQQQQQQLEEEQQQVIKMKQQVLSKDEHMTISQLQQQVKHKQVKNEKKLGKYQEESSEYQVEDSSFVKEMNQNDSNWSSAQQQDRKMPIKSISPIYPQRNEKQRKNNKLKCSLISNEEESQELGLKDTVYSYFEVEEEFEDDNSSEEEHSKNKIRINESNRYRQTGMMEDRYQRQSLRQSTRYSQKYSQLKKSGIQSINNYGIHKINELKKTLRKSCKNLNKVRQLLKNERNKNRDQEDKIKKMEAMIDVLNTRVQMNEERIKSGHNMYQLFQKTNHIISSSAATSVNVGSSNNHSGGGIGKIRTDSCNERSKSVHTGITALQETNQQSSFIGQKKDLSPMSITNIKNLSSNNQLSLQNFAGMHSTSTLNQSKQLMEINDRLTKQIEDNISLFDNLNNEITLKDQVLVENQMIIQDKEKEIEILMQKITDMRDSMKNLMEITRKTTESTNTNKANNSIEKESIQQFEQNRKIQKNQKIFELNQTFSNLILKTGLKQNEIEQQEQIAAEQQRRTLQCVQLKTLSSMDEISGINTRNCSNQKEGLELNINQLMTQKGMKVRGDNDILPIKLMNEQFNYGQDYSQIQETTLMNSIDRKVLQSIANSNKVSSTPKLSSNYQQINHYQQQPSTILPNDDSTMLKYSQDISMQRNSKGKEGFGILFEKDKNNCD